MALEFVIGAILVLKVADTPAESVKVESPRVTIPPDLSRPTPRPLLSKDKGVELSIAADGFVSSLRVRPRVLLTLK